METLSKLSSSDWAAWVQAIGTILAVLAAIVISRRESVANRQREAQARAERLKACWRAVRAEVEVCGIWADGYCVEPVIRAPSYRFPTVAADKVLHELLLLARLTTEETKSLLDFFSNVDAVNRGFDLAQEINARIPTQDKTDHLNRQFAVNLSRIEKHLRPTGDMYRAAMNVIERHMA